MSHLWSFTWLYTQIPQSHQWKQQYLEHRRKYLGADDMFEDTPTFISVISRRITHHPSFFHTFVMGPSLTTKALPCWQMHHASLLSSRDHRFPVKSRRSKSDFLLVVFFFGRVLFCDFSLIIND